MTLRVGVVGTGQIGTAHAARLAREISGAAVTVVHDVDHDRAAGVADGLGARAVETFEDVVAAPDVDAVLIASPDARHAEQLLVGLRAGKPILCEKPLATTEADARRVLEAEVAGGRRLVQLGFMRRFDPAYAQLKRELTPEGIGEALVVHHLHRNTRAPYGLVTEQTLTNMVVHELDISRWLLEEELASVLVITGKPGPLTPAGESDPLLVLLRSASGVLVEVEAFANAQYGYEVSCRVTGAQGQSVMGDGSYVTRSKAFSRGVELPELWVGRFADAYRLQLQSWVDAVSSGRPAAGASVWDGYVATLVADRAVESYRSGVRVDVDPGPRPALYEA